MHDAGFSISVQDHEMHSCRIAELLMLDHGFPDSDIRMVKNMIMATRIPQKPKNILEKIICDADLDYLGRSDYYSKSHRLFKELKSRGVIQSDTEWHKEQIQFLENHRYHTDFARKYLAPEKKKRLEELKRGLS
jgi:predicted metal-dependent HD superfamily phosphohydrolase